MYLFFHDSEMEHFGDLDSIASKQFLLFVSAIKI